MSVMHTPSRRELVSERKRLLKDLRIDEATLRERARNYALTTTEFDVYAKLDEIDYLLADE